MSELGEVMKYGDGMNPDDFLMFSGDQWALYKLDETSFDSWIYHCCNPMATRFTVNRFISVSEALHGVVKCWKCQQPCPDEIVTLWKLHNFDAIQEHEGYNDIRRSIHKYSIDV